VFARGMTAAWDTAAVAATTNVTMEKRIVDG